MQTCVVYVYQLLYVYDGKLKKIWFAEFVKIYLKIYYILHLAINL